MLSQLPELLLAVPILVISLSDLHDLLSFPFRFLDLLPCLLLLHFEQSDTVCQQLRIVRCLLLILSSFFQRPCNLFRLIIVVRILTVGIRVALVVLSILWLVTVLFVTSELLIWMFLSLRYWLGLFWRLHFFLLRIITVHSTL